MIEFYEEIKLVHISAALASGSLFFTRGVLQMTRGRAAATAPTLRYTAYAIDTVLLTAALMLAGITAQYPLADAWLTVKIGLIILYIALGIVAFWKGSTQAIRTGAWLAALLVYAFIYSVARSHHPLGIFSDLT